MLHGCSGDVCRAVSEKSAFNAVETRALCEPRAATASAVGCPRAKRALSSAASTIGGGGVPGGSGGHARATVYRSNCRVTSHALTTMCFLRKQTNRAGGVGTCTTHSAHATMRSVRASSRDVACTVRAVGRYDDALTHSGGGARALARCEVPRFSDGRSVGQVHLPCAQLDRVATDHQCLLLCGWKRVAEGVWLKAACSSKHAARSLWLDACGSQRVARTHRSTQHASHVTARVIAAAMQRARERDVCDVL
jgi:hypothetical protein